MHYLLFIYCLICFLICGLFYQLFALDYRIISVIFCIVFASLFPYFPVSSEYIGSDDPPSAHSNSWRCVPSLKEQEQN